MLASDVGRFRFLNFGPAPGRTRPVRRDPGHGASLGARVPWMTMLRLIDPISVNEAPENIKLAVASGSKTGRDR